MPKLKIYLPDVNVWVAAASRRHVHSRAAVQWLDSVQDDQLAFCRVTQMGLLRLLTNRHVMGSDTLNQAQAWEVYERIMLDSRVRFLGEPAGVEEIWKKYSHSSEPATNLWTDAYLLALAESLGIQVVSFDRALHERAQNRVALLAF